MKKFFGLLIACALLISSLIPSAYAASVSESESEDVINIQDILNQLQNGNTQPDPSTSANTGTNTSTNTSTSTNSNTIFTIYVDGKIVEGVYAYPNSNGEAVINHAGYLHTLFPKETEGMFFSTVLEENTLASWAERFGYTFRQEGSVVYMTKEGDGMEDFPEILPDPEEENTPSTPEAPTTIPDLPEGKMELFVNGLRYTADTPLSNIGTRFAFRQFQNRIYINSDGKIPVVVTVDGKPVSFTDQQPLIVDGRTLLPVRDIATMLGLEVDWNQDTKRVTLTGDGIQIALWIGRNTLWFNGEETWIDVPPQILNNRTMLPVRCIWEQLGYKVSFEGATNGLPAIVKLESP